MVGLLNFVISHHCSVFLGGAICVIGIICLLAVVLNQHIEAQRKQQEAARKKQEAERLEAARKQQEAERLEAERRKQEAERLEAERKRQEAERLEAERKQQEAERLEAARQKQEAERLETERQKQEAERLEAERKQQEAERLEAARQKQEAERLETERQKQEAERLEAERLETERQKQEAERLEAARKKQEAERLEAERKRQAVGLKPKTEPISQEVKKSCEDYWKFALSECRKLKTHKGDNASDIAARKEIAMGILKLTNSEFTKTELYEHFKLMYRTYVHPLQKENGKLSSSLEQKDRDEALRTAYEELFFTL